jgi:hypothetical protein
MCCAHLLMARRRLKGTVVVAWCRNRSDGVSASVTLICKRDKIRNPTGQLIAAGMIILSLWAGNPLKAQNAVSTDDLVRRVQIPLATLSPDGRFAAYLLVRGDPGQDEYDVKIRVIDTRQVSKPITVREYWMSPEETFNEVSWLMDAAGDIRWVANDVLMFTAKTGSAMQLATWNAQDGKARIVLNGHDRIEIENADDLQKTLTVKTKDFVNLATSNAGSPPDRAWRIRDGYRFYGSLKNPKMGRWSRTQRWTISFTGDLNPRREGESTEDWESEPEEWTARRPTTATSDEMGYMHDETRSSDGMRVAAVEDRNSNLHVPGESYSNFRIVVKEGTNTQVIVPETRPYAWTRILDWSTDNQSIRYLVVRPESTDLNVVSLNGNIKVLRTAPELLEKPCPYFRRCEIVSRDGHYALLRRSTNIEPAELVKVDLQTGAVKVLESPNESFARAAHPEVHFYEIKGLGGDAWGRLHLPLGYRLGKRYPLVITQYGSTPGFAAATGDEVPILPLCADGIAVFDMHSAGLNQTSVVGDFRAEMNRVRRPLSGMKWIVKQLVADGIVDQERIGLAGSSYGAEIAMYAYWNWTALRTVSATTASWDPALYFFGGIGYAQQLEERGFRNPDEAGTQYWRELAAGLNARGDLPPLLFQSPDGEQAYTVPTWFRLRRVGAPVEWFEYPNEGHIKRGPANKWWVFERNLDWFRFWLKDEVDDNPTKADQYRRWHELRDSRALRSETTK